jgi:hypothetical protein
MKKFLLSTAILCVAIAATAQYPTIVTNSSNCTVFRNFNNSDEGFSSPSIYSNADDVSFFWNSSEGAEIESSGLAARNGSLISPVYIQSEPGVVTLGFRYVAPAGTQYRIRIISAMSTPPLEILATTANGPVYTSLPGTAGNVCLLISDQDLVAGQPIRFEFTFRAVAPGNVLFDNLALSVSGGPLPVTFEGFVARENSDGTTKLLWNVGEEVNVKGYYVESSTDGISFTNAGFVTAEGKKIYSLDYTQKLVQTTYFRVKNIDFDGRSKYSSIIKMYAKTTGLSQIQAYPVPANELVTIQHNKAAAGTLMTLFTPDGKVLQQVKAMPNTFQTQLHIEKLGAGVYFVKYEDEKGGVQTIKVIKN